MGKARTSSSNAADEPRGVRAGIATLYGCDGEREDAGGFEAGAFGEQAGQCADKQRGADDEDEREGHLQRDDALAEADAAETGAAALAERADQAVAAGVEGGSKAAQQAGGKAGEEREREQAKADVGAERVAGEIVRQERDQRAHGERRHSDPEHAAATASSKLSARS